MATTPGSPKCVIGYPTTSQRGISHPAATVAAASVPHPIAVPPSLSIMYLHPTHTTTTRIHRERTSFLCLALYAAFAAFAVVALTVLILTLSLKPRELAFAVDSATVTSLNTTAVELTATFDITLFFRNPNHKLTVSIKNLEAVVRYGNDGVSDRALASTFLPPLSLGTRRETGVRAQFEVVNEFVDSDVAQGIAAERAGGSVNFGLTLFARVRSRSGIYHSWPRTLRVECDLVTFTFSPINNGTGTLAVPSTCYQV